MTKNFYRAICWLFLSTILFAAKPGFCQKVAVTDVSYSVQDSNVVIRYNLNGPGDKSYRVVLALRRESSPDFRFIPIDVSGDIGKGEFAGAGREIVWHMYRDIPNGLYGGDYYFEVTASLLGGGGASWLYYVGGAAVLGGAAVVIINKKSHPSGPTSTSVFPVPPGRPY